MGVWLCTRLQALTFRNLQIAIASVPPDLRHVFCSCIMHHMLYILAAVAFEESAYVCITLN